MANIDKNKIIDDFAKEIINSPHKVHGNIFFIKNVRIIFLSILISVSVFSFLFLITGHTTQPKVLFHLFFGTPFTIFAPLLCIFLFMFGVSLDIFYIIYILILILVPLAYFNNLNFSWKSVFTYFALNICLGLFVYIIYIIYMFNSGTFSMIG